MNARALLLIVGVTLLGVVGGAAFAAPAELRPVAEALLGWSASTARAAGTQALAALPAPGVIADALLGDRSSRRLAMLAAAAALLVSGAGALVLQRRRRGRAAGGRPVVRLPLGAASPVPMGPPRRRSARTTRPVTPVQVRAMAEDGSSASDIARATGLPLDAVSLLLAVSSPERKLPPVSA